MKHLFQSSQDYRTAWKPTGVKHKFSESHKSIWHIMNRTRFTVINIRWGNKFDPLQFCYFYRASIQISWILQDVSFTACENTLSHHRWTDDLWGSNLWCWPIIIPEQSWECLEKHKYYHHDFTFNEAGPDSFIQQPTTDLLLEWHYPHLDRCWGEIRLMAIYSEDGDIDESFHLLW